MPDFETPPMTAFAPRKRAAWVLLGILILPHPAAAQEWSGVIAAQQRWFPQAPLDPVQHRGNSALAFEPEFYYEWDDGYQSFTFVPFLRLDQHDTERSHHDIRELEWLYIARRWEMRAGIRKVFWGVTESQHLVDVINQTDLVERPDGEAKLGQPMINIAWVQDWGTLDFFLLPYFRERTFPGTKGRLRFPLPVDTQNARYESAKGRRHWDFALRWSHSVHLFDLGVSYFKGTNRDPRFQLSTDANGNPVLLPYYALITQVGIDLQATVEAWLWKLEALYRDQKDSRYFALTGGLEYTFFGVFGSTTDLGIVTEYLYDERGISDDLTTPTSPFQDDVMIGLRWAVNDENDTQILFGTIVDTDTGAKIHSLEAQRRIGDHWTVELESRFFSATKPQDLLHSLRNDDFLEIELAYHF